MANNVVRLENSRRHNTKAEIEAREKAESQLTRKKIRLTAPARLKENPEAKKYWTSIVRKMRDIEMLDDLDADMLAVYCEISARRDAMQDMYNARPGDGRLITDLTSTERLLMQYADKLGLTPNGRMRLAKKRAEKTEDQNAGLFD